MPDPRTRHRPRGPGAKVRGIEEPKQQAWIVLMEKLAGDMATDAEWVKNRQEVVMQTSHGILTVSLRRS